MATLSQHADKILQSLNGCEIHEVPRLVKAHATSKMQQILEVFDSLSKKSWATENAPRLEVITSTMVEELISHAAFYGKNGASFEGDARDVHISLIANVSCHFQAKCRPWLSILQPRILHLQRLCCVNNTTGLFP